MTEWLHFHFSLSCIGEGNGTPFQRSCLENPRDGGAWWAAIYGVTQSRTRLKQLSISFPGGSEGKASVHNAGDLGLIPGSARSPGEGNGYPLQYSCLENPMDGGAWQATVHEVTKSLTQLSNFTFLSFLKLFYNGLVLFIIAELNKNYLIVLLTVQLSSNSVNKVDFSRNNFW